MWERFLQASHESSVELLYRIGWKPMDTMCAYLLSMTTNRMYSLSPDAVREAVRLDGEMAVRLLDKKVLGEMIVHHHSSYQAWWQKMKEHPVGRIMAGNLLWGYYRAGASGGTDRNRYISCHMADLLHGYGAQMVFDGIWRGPEYGPEIITAEKVVFYRFQHFLLWEHVPESLVCALEELPARFVSTALAAFRAIVGRGEKRE